MSVLSQQITEHFKAGNAIVRSLRDRDRNPVSAVFQNLSNDDKGKAQFIVTSNFIYSLHYHRVIALVFPGPNNLTILIDENFNKEEFLLAEDQVAQHFMTVLSDLGRYLQREIGHTLNLQYISTTMFDNLIMQVEAPTITSVEHIQELGQKFLTGVDMSAECVISPFNNPIQQ